MRLWYENKAGQVLDLLNAENWLLVDQDGLTDLPENILSTKNTASIEGSFVYSRMRNERQIILTHNFIKRVRESRREFAEILDQENSGMIRYQDDEMNVFIDVEVESCEIANMGQVTTSTTTFLAPYPYFRNFNEYRATKRAVIGGFSFPFRFPLTFGTTSDSNMIEIENDGAVDVGFSFVLKAETGNVSNIVLTNHLNQVISLVDYTLREGCRVEFSSVDNEKSVHEIDENGNVTNLLNVFDGSFFKARKGTNRFQFSATGVENATLEIMVRPAFKVV